MIRKYVITITVSALIGFCLIFSNLSQVALAQTELSVLLDGQKITFPDEQPRIDENHRVLIPVRFVSEALEATVGFQNQTVFISHGQKTITLTIGSNTVTVDGQDVIFDSQPVIVGDRMLVPLRFVSEALGKTVEWDMVSRYVWIGGKEVSLMENVAQTFGFDDFRTYYGEADYLTDKFDRYEDIQVFSHEQLPVQFKGRLTETTIYNIWMDEYEGIPVVKIHYDGRHFDSYFLTEDNIPRGRTNMEAWRVTNEDGSFVGIFNLITPSDGYRRNVLEWESFQPSDILYIGFSVGTYSLPLYKASFGN